MAEYFIKAGDQMKRFTPTPEMRQKMDELVEWRERGFEVPWTWLDRKYSDKLKKSRETKGDDEHFEREVMIEELLREAGLTKCADEWHQEFQD